MNARLLLVVSLVALAGVTPPVEAVEATDVAATVIVQNFEFEDSRTGTPVTTIAAGESVRFLWASGCHSVTQGLRGPGNHPLGPSTFDTGVLCTSYGGDGPTEVILTFETPGIYKYYCRPHGVMEAVIVVTAGA